MLKNKVLLLFVVLVVLAVSTAGCVSKSKYDTLMQDYNTSQTNLTSAQREYDLLKAEMESLQKEWETAKANLDAEIATNQNTIASLSQDIATLQAKLEATLDTEIRQVYAFTYLNKDYKWELSIPLRTYLHYKEIARIGDTSKYNEMIMDDYAESQIYQIIKEINDAVLEYNLNKSDTINLVGTFVQSLVFANNDVTTPYDDYPRYPIETLFDQSADCEDTTILAAALLYRLEFNEVIFVFTEKPHVAVGVYNPATIGLDGWEYQGKRYIYLETTGDAWTLGHAPNVYQTLQPQIYLIGE